jgi:Metal-dependent hydrolase
MKRILLVSIWVIYTGLLLLILPIAVNAAPVSLVGLDRENVIDNKVIIKVMTFNVHSAINWYGHLDLDGLTEFIRGCDPDIVGLQEVDLAWSGRTSFYDIPSELAQRLHKYYAFSSSLEHNNGYFGNLILSKFPIAQQWTCLLPGTLEQRSLAFVQLLIGGERVNFLTTHLGLSVEDRLQQAGRIIEFINEVSGPLIMTGDFNGGDSDPAVAQLRQNFFDLQGMSEYKANGTFRSKNGMVNVASKMDYILATPEFSFLKLQVVDNYISDHLPLIAELELDMTGDGQQIFF